MSWKDLIIKPDVPEPNPGGMAASVPSANVPSASSVFGRPTPSPGMRSTAVTFNANPFGTPAPVTAAVTINSSEVQEFLNEIAQELDKSTAAGYKEFMAQMELLAAAIPDERTRIGVAIGSVSAMKNLTSAQIASSVQDRITLLNAHKSYVTKGIAEEVAKRNGMNASHIDDLNRRLAKNAAEQDRLKNEAVSMANDLAATQAQSQDITTKSQNTSTAYDFAFKTAMDHLTATLSRLPR